MPSSNRRRIGGRNYRNYSDKLLNQVIRDIKLKKISMREAHKRYGIHRNSLALKIRLMEEAEASGTTCRKPGRPTVLSEEEEESICAHVVCLATYGFPVTKLELRLLVKQYLARIGRPIPGFLHGGYLPGKEWASTFLRRHRKKLTVRLSQSVSRYRAGINSETVNSFFDNLTNELQDIPPANLWNYDESNLADDPGAEKVIVRRGCKHPEVIKNSTKASTSIMVCGNAAGDLAPLYVVYRAQNVYPEWVEGGPERARYNRSKSGWFDAVTFDDWFEFLMLPILKRQEGRKALIGDNLSSHLSSHVINLCQQNNIKFIALPPNATHLLQPLDVAFFGPFKKVWRKVLNNWKMTPQGRQLSSLPKQMFPVLLKRAVEEMHPKTADNLKGGFRGSGIYPLDRLQVLKRICDNRLEENVVEKVSESFLEEIRSSRAKITEVQRPKRKSKINVPPGRGITVQDLEPPPSENTEPTLGLPSTSSGATHSRRMKSQLVPKKKNTTVKRKRREESFSETEDDLSESDLSLTSEESTPSLETYMRAGVESEDDDCDPGFPEDELATPSIPQKSATSVETQHQEEDGERFVLVQYYGKLYPGRVMEIADDGETQVSAMAKKGEFWEWPALPDIVWYHHHQIKKDINPPSKISENLFHVEF